MQTIRWGIIGCGDVTEVKSGPAFQKAQGSQLVAVMRRDAAKAADYAQRHNVPRWYASADALIADKNVDAVYVATPPGTHELYAMKTLAAKKPCYVEKPMARNAAEARRMVEGFHAQNIPLFVAYYRRALPRFLKAKEILDSGALGRLFALEYQYHDGQMSKLVHPLPWRFQPEHSGGGLFMDLGSHALDLFDFFVGPIQFGWGRVRNRESKDFDVEDSVTLRFDTPLKISGVGHWSFFGGEQMDAFMIGGELGALHFSCFGNGPIYLKRANGTTEAFDLPNPPHVQQPLIQNIVDDLLGKAKSPSTGQTALRTQQVMDAALESYYGGREDGFWRRDWPGT
jgi:1,5-anhydro-D-fructose reductase (1,5-anhydro-D-mannitol-forming)